METDSCIPKEPFIKLGSGSAPVLDYNLPEKTCFSVWGHIPTGVNLKVFRPWTLQAPKGNYWERMAARKPADILKEMTARLNGGLDLSGYVRNASLLKGAVGTPDKEASSSGEENPAGLLRSARPASVAVPSQRTTQIDVRLIAQAIGQGLMPNASKSFGGEPRMTFIPAPMKPMPKIVAVEEYRVCSFLGDYGAGRTVRTFTLLPGERTTISINSYQDRVETSSRSESILDSFSQNSADEFEQSLQAETGEQDSSTSTTGTSVGGGLSVGLDLGFIEAGVDASGGATAGTSVERQSYSKQITGALERHLSSTASYREVDVNVTSSDTTSSGESTSTVRELENINRSRVLNFVFRQLLQEYVTITFLRDVKFVYTSGYPGSTKVIEIPELEAFLKTVVAPSKVASTLDKLLKPYCQVYNYQDQRFSIVEEVVEDFGDCPFAEEGETISYWRKRKDITDEYEGFTVPGVILDTKKTILRTPSVIADALLGQGEALDCYNISLQSASVDKAQLANTTTEAVLATLDAIADPIERAAAYRKMLGECCDDGSADESAPGA